MPAADKRARKKEHARAARAAREAADRRRKRLRSAIIVGIVVVLFIGVIAIANVVSGGGKKKSGLPAGCVATVPKTGRKPTFSSAPAMAIDPAKTYVAKLTTTCGAFEVTLDAPDAPKTVNSFVFLAKRGFYDGLKFHRVAKDFVVQGGDPKGNGSGGPGYSLPTEPPRNGYKRGSVAMANAGPDTTGSQFFVVLNDHAAQELGGPPYSYSALGEVTKGLDVVEKLGSLYNRDQIPSDPRSQRTAVPLYIFKVTITQS